MRVKPNAGTASIRGSPKGAATSIRCSRGLRLLWRRPTMCARIRNLSPHIRAGVSSPWAPTASGAAIPAPRCAVSSRSIGTGSESPLCKEISYDPGAMTRMIDRLELKGLIRRLPHADDRRRMNLELTPKGKAVYPKLRASAVTVQNRFLRGFTKIEARQLEGFLQRMIAGASQSRYETEE